MHVALYARVSTHQQHQEHTIDSQVDKAPCGRTLGA
jgi:DNA invertase Pin-like site-specific DNA recombinase